MSSTREYILEDQYWGEVKNINTYAVFMGYLSMSIKGLGFLVLTWTTVVLLGGFVSMLQKKDFWCLTFITLVQMAGIMDVNLNEKLRYMGTAFSGMKLGVCSVVVTADLDLQSFVSICILSYSIKPILVLAGQLLLACVLLWVQIVALTAVLCPLAIIYVLGILISGGISVWRLIEHDYGGNSDVEASNLAPAMDTLYYLALLQSLLFCYRFILRRAGKKLAKRTSTKDCGDSELQVVSDYLHEIRKGCERNPSFAKGKNLITYAIDKISSRSPTECVSGVKILYTAICIFERKHNLDIVTGLMKHLVMSASSSRHALQKLLETLNSSGLHDRETRNQAARIVECLAYNIKLENFPQGIEHLSSMIGTFEDYWIAQPFEQDYLHEKYGEDWKLHFTRQLPSQASKIGKAYKELLLKGLCILRKLAADENNCRVMINTRDLVSKIMAPVTFELLDHTTNDHGAWSDIVEASLKVMIQLTGAPRQIGAKLRHEISRCEGAINTLWMILNCNTCNDGLRLCAIQILTQLYMDTENSRSVNSILKKESGSREDFVRMLLDIFTQDNKYSNSIRAYAGGALPMVCFYDGIIGATMVIQTGGGEVVESLTKVLVHDENETCRQSAATFLDHLCTHYNKDDEYHGKLRKAMTKAMPEVIGAILPCGDETHIGKETHQDKFTKPENDIENQCEDNGKGNGISTSSSSYLPNDDKKVVGDILRSGDETYNGKEADQDGLAKQETDNENQCDKGQGNGINSSSSSHPQNNEQDAEEKIFQAVRSAKLLSSLLCLLATVYDMMFISDLPPQLDASNFLNKLKELVLKSRVRPTVENLLQCKAIGKIVISMMKHNSDMFIKQEDYQSFIETLSTASKNFLDLDYSMVFNAASIFDTTSKFDRCTLVSLVKEAQELHSMMPSISGSG